jgi:acetyl-CoA C-acetyltransferase
MTPSAVLVSAVRTPIGRARKGALKDVLAVDLAQIVLREAVARSGISPQEIDDIVLAESLQGGGVLGRFAAVSLGWDLVPSVAVNRHCAGGLAAIAAGAASVIAGAADVVVAGGTESLSTSPLSMRVQPGRSDPELWYSPTHPDRPEAPALDMTITVGENTARELGLTRHDLDAWAALSHSRAITAIDAGTFADELVPVPVVQDDGSTIDFTIDEFPRRGVTVESLGQLKVLHPELPDATVTAGNASGLNDGAAAVVVVSEAYARTHGLAPLARIRAWTSVGIEPARTGMAPTVAIPRVLDRTGLTLQDVDFWEVNEAFCTVPVATIRKNGLDPERLNIHGSGVSLGHPIAATGARMVTTTVHAMRRRGSQFAGVALCAGGGMGSALLLEAI